jgi:hypothetical protein
MTQEDSNSEIGVGATHRLRLRVSIAALARVVFEHPQTGEQMLALERKATLHKETDRRLVEVKSQPFGGALRLYQPEALREVIGAFHFDSKRSRSERDFRIFIEPAAWQAVQEFCLHHFRQPDDPVLEADPVRELTEEFGKTLDVSTAPHQFRSTLVGTVIDEHPSETSNYFARGALTARIYRLFETQILDRSLANRMLSCSAGCSDQDLGELALRDFESGGRGWANTVLTLPLKQVSELYAALPAGTRNRAVDFQGHWLDETVAAILEAPPVRKP